MYKYQEIESIIPYAKMEILYINEQAHSLNITPVPGYLLHANELDIELFDKDTLEPLPEKELGFTKQMKSCALNYDFSINDRGFYTIREEDINA